LKSTSAFLVGLSMGAGLALLFAPQTGRKTQKFVSQKAQKGLDHVAATGKQVASEMKEWADKTKHNLVETVEAYQKKA
jgi:gas vesicle protein